MCTELQVSSIFPESIAELIREEHRDTQMREYFAYWNEAVDSLPAPTHGHRYNFPPLFAVSVDWELLALDEAEHFARLEALEEEPVDEERLARKRADAFLYEVDTLIAMTPKFSRDTGRSVGSRQRELARASPS